MENEAAAKGEKNLFLCYLRLLLFNILPFFVCCFDLIDKASISDLGHEVGWRPGVPVPEFSRFLAPDS